MQSSMKKFGSPGNRTRFRALPALALFGLIAAAGCSSIVDAGRSAIGGPVDVTPPPATLPPVESAGDDALLGGRQYSVNTPDEQWGVGFLVAPGRRLDRIELPLFDTPRGAQWGWFIEGRGYNQRANTAAPSRPGAWLQILGGDQALIVIQEERGDWIEVRWGEPSDARGGLAWTNVELARQAGLTYTPWTTAFIGSGGLMFRDPSLNYNLREQPGVDAPVLRRVTGRDYDMEAVDISGDWMRVIVHEPPKCAPRSDSSGDEVLLGGLSGALAGGESDGEAEVQRRSDEGWLKWRSVGKGPWIDRTNRCIIQNPLTN